MYDYLQTQEWKEQRGRILRRDAHTCQICGKSGSGMNVHHICYRHPLSDVSDRDLVTLCRDCHQAIHSIQSRMNDFADTEMKRQKVEWGVKMAEEINRAFPSGIDGTRKSTAISIIRGTFYDQRGNGSALRPDFTTLQKNVKTKRK